MLSLPASRGDHLEIAIHKVGLTPRVCVREMLILYDYQETHPSSFSVLSLSLSLSLSIMLPLCFQPSFLFASQLQPFSLYPTLSLYLLMPRLLLSPFSFPCHSILLISPPLLVLSPSPSLSLYLSLSLAFSGRLLWCSHGAAAGRVVRRASEDSSMVAVTAETATETAAETSSIMQQSTCNQQATREDRHATIDMQSTLDLGERARARWRERER